ncbi:sensor histidine kinase [Bacteriovoracales bacterium]|nr:sensor histidine kinase [Bacteriovoracales bacterium]
MVNAREAKSVVKTIEYFEDSRGKLEINDVLLESFLLASTDIPNLGLSSSVYWFRVTLKTINTSETSYILSVENPLIDELNIYRKNGKAWVSHKMGDTFAFSKREIKDRNFSFNIKLSEKEKVIYFKVKTYSGVIFPLKVYRPDVFTEKNEKDNYFYGFFFGIISWIIFFNFISYFYSRLIGISHEDIHGSYLFLGVYILSYMGLLLSYTGLGAKYIYPNSPWIQNQGFHIFILLTSMSFNYFIKTYLNDRFEKMGRMIDILSIFSIFLLVLIFFLGNEEWTVAYVILPYGLFSMIFSGTCIFVLNKYGGTFVRPLLYSFIFLILGILMTLSVYLGSFKNLFFLEKGLFFGLIVQLGIFSTGYIGILNRQKIESESKAEELEEAKKEIEVKADDLSNFSNLLMKSVEDLEGALKEVEESNKLKTNFLSNISHEIKTPLNAIMGFTDILKSAYHTEAQKDYLQSISESGVELNKTLDKILDLSKIESGDLLLNKAHFDLVILEKSLLPRMSNLAERKEIDFSYIFKEGLPSTIDIDPFRFEELLEAVLSNAIKFTEKGDVKLTLDFEGNEKKGSIIINVEDSGIGMSKEELKKVFKPFAKVKGSLSASEGLGLGLSFVDAITTRMKGEIKVTSVLNEGTHFLVKLPNISVIELEKGDEIESVQPFSQEVVCIIEENKYMMEKVKETLEELNLNVLTFTNLEAFSGYINFSRADLILVQRDLTSLVQFLNFKMFLLKDIPYLKLVTNRTRLKDSLYVYDSVENYHKIISKFINRGNKTKEESAIKFDNLNIKDREGLFEKINLLGKEVDEVKDLMEINLIESLGKKVTEIAKEHNSSALKEWSVKVMRHCKKFEINSIEKELNGFHELVKKMKD